MADADVLAVNQVACEACRSKKCKCDRILPTCGQCRKLGNHCAYPQSSKRGFPEGYIARLEQRLVATEIALFETLTQLAGVEAGDVEIGQTLRRHAATQSKTARTEEWEQLPLGSHTQRLQWWHEKRSVLGMNTGAFPIANSAKQHQESSMPAGQWAAPLDARQTSTSTHQQAWQGSPQSTQLGSTMQVDDEAHQARGSMVAQTPERFGVSRAQALSTSQSRRFF